MRFLTFLLLLALSTPALSDDFDFDAYRPAQVIDIHIYVANHAAGTTHWLDASHAKFNTVAQVTGKRRAILPERKAFIQMWVDYIGHPQSFADMFQTEIEVMQGTASYWMPIQQLLLAPLDEEVAEGQPVRLYLLLLGAYEQDPVITIAEFSAQSRTGHP